MPRDRFLRQTVGVLFLVTTLQATVGAQAYAAFGLRPPTDIVVPGIADKELAALQTTLDRLLEEALPERFAATASDALWQFARRMQAYRLTKMQEARVLEQFDRIAKSRPEAAVAVGGPRRMVAELTVGKKAPEITGLDLDGKPLKLSSYKNKVVVLAFASEWCAICRTQEPYERFLMERYEKWPLALLTVQTGTDRAAALRQWRENPVAHRTWWDEPAGEAGGSIAGAWHVIGWPASYVIDGDGIIRFVDLRDEDLLKAVRQLVDVQVDRNQKALSQKPSK